jgi:hypothetical protein
LSVVNIRRWFGHPVTLVTQAARRGIFGSPDIPTGGPERVFGLVPIRLNDHLTQDQK